MSNERVRAVQERRRSGAAGPHSSRTGRREHLEAVEVAEALEEAHSAGGGSAGDRFSAVALFGQSVTAENSRYNNGILIIVSGVAPATLNWDDAHRLRDWLTSTLED